MKPPLWVNPPCCSSYHVHSINALEMTAIPPLVKTIKNRDEERGKTYKKNNNGGITEIEKKKKSEQPSRLKATTDTAKP